MKINNKGIALIQQFESCKLKAYKDLVGIWTIGWGNTQYTNGRSVKSGDVITQAEADQLFKSILSRFESGVEKRLRTDVRENQFAALVCFAYNVGFGNFDSSTLLKKVNANEMDPTIRDEFAKWNKVKTIVAGVKVYKVANGLTRRRKAEADLYFSI